MQSTKLQIRKQSSKVTNHKYWVLSSNTKIKYYIYIYIYVCIMSYINNSNQITISNVLHKQHKTNKQCFKQHHKHTQSSCWVKKELTPCN